MLEELKIKVKPKMVVVKRELAKISKIIRDFEDENSEVGMPVFSKTVGFFLDGLQFDSAKVLGGLDDEIQELKREGEKMHQLNLEKIKSLMERVSLSEEKYKSMQESHEKISRVEKQFEEL